MRSLKIISFSSFFGSRLYRLSPIGEQVFVQALESVAGYLRYLAYGPPSLGVSIRGSDLTPLRLMSDLTFSMPRFKKLVLL